MMLYHFDSPNDMGNQYHWTEIFIIITVTTMFVEELRQVSVRLRFDPSESLIL